MKNEEKQNYQSSKVGDNFIDRRVDHLNRLAEQLHFTRLKSFSND